MTDFSEMSLSEVYDYVSHLQENLLKSVHREAALGKVAFELRHAYSSAMAKHRMYALKHLMEVRRMLIPMAPFYPWARDLLLGLPMVEGMVVASADPAQPIREILDSLASEIYRIQSKRKEWQEEMPHAEKALSKKVAQMLRFKEREER